MRKLLKIAALLLAALLVLVAGLFGYAQTQDGKQRLASLLAGTLSGPGQEVRLEGLEGFLPFDIRLAQLEVADAQGAWLEARDVRLAWTPSRLLRGVVHVEAVGARTVALHRLPPSPEPTEPPQPFSLPELPELPTSLPRLELDRLYVDELDLGAPVLGQAAAFRIEGSAGVAPDGATARADLTVRRTDQPTAEATLAAVVDPATQRLRLGLSASETGGLLAAASGRPEAGDLRLTLNGDGPLADWHGNLTLEAERLASVGLDLALAYAERKRLALDGGIDLAPGLLPEPIAALVGPKVALQAAAVAPTPRRIALERLDVKAASAAFSGAAEADLAQDSVRATATLMAPDLAPFTPLAGVPLAGAAKLKLDAEGSTAQPTSLRFTADAVADALALDGRSLAPGGNVTLTLVGELPAEGRAKLSRLALRSPLLRADGQGEIDRATLAGAARIEVTAPDLAGAIAALAPEAAQPGLSGSFRLATDVTIAEQAERIEAVLTGGGQGLGLPAGLQEMVGPSPTLTAKAVVEPERSARVEGLRLEGAGFRLEGDPGFSFADQGLSGSLRLTAPDLRRLEALAGQTLRGAVELAASLGGTVQAPDLRLDGRGEDLAFGAQRLDRLTLAATATGALASPAGVVRVEAERSGRPLTLATDYRLEGRQLALRGLRLDGPGTALAGGFDVALDGPLATGGIAGEVRDLAALAPWHGQDLAGRATLDLKLATPGGRQDARLQLGASRLRGGFGQVQSVRLDASVQDALGRPSVDGQLVTRGFANPGLTLGEATLGARGPLNALALDLAAAGEQGGRRLRMRTTATIDVLSSPKTVRLASLDGSLAGESIRLTQPATLSLGNDGAVALDRLALSLGGGSLTATGRLGGGRVDAEVTATSLPLAMLESFGGPSLRGSAQARIGLSGRTSAPEARATLGLRDLALDPSLQPKPDVQLEASLARGRLAADLSLRELGSQPVTARLAMPVRFSLEPFAFDLSQQAPLDGAITGQVDLSRVARVAALQGIQLAGSLVLDLSVAGTPAAPAVSGTANLAKGVLQEINSGINLRNIELAVRGQGQRLALERLRAEDRAGGTLDGTGWAGLGPGGGVGYGASLRAVTLRVLDNSLGSVILSGNVSAEGDGEGADVRGRLTLDRADIAIPEGGGPSVPVIEVSEVGTGLRARPERPAPAPGMPFAVRLAVTIEAPARLFVRGRGLDSEWGGTLNVNGLASAPEIVGALEFRRGFLDLLDRRFTITEGRISFVGSTPPLPMIELEARAATNEIQVVVRLEGPAVDPKLTLTSEPVLPQDEILSRLLFGSSVARLTPMQGLRLAAAVSTLQGGGGISSVLAALRRGLGVDTLDVQSGETPQDSTARAGKYVSDNVYVEVERGVAQGSGKARVNIELTPNLSVGTEVNEQSQTGVGLEWRYDY